ncbi:hypothetical protein HT574_17425 [Parageobacillus sp. VR-IP]|uniref:hypothetical protein n=1 Tax=Parageobacillus sp. VR-IP TaxID=2742205 RepID=UPI0015820AFE|nr:hypothetical protein [Parageobacillus sp. VR-IP]NUK31798.1 hypothetical protein [Parageobacillus sp. VR-IP]
MRERKEYYYAEAKKLGLFSSGEEQSISSRQPLDGAERTSSSFLHSLFGFFILVFLIILFNVIVPCMKKFVPQTGCFRRNFDMFHMTESSIRKKEKVLIAIWQNRNISLFILIFPMLPFK